MKRAPTIWPVLIGGGIVVFIAGLAVSLWRPETASPPVSVPGETAVNDPASHLPLVSPTAAPGPVLPAPPRQKLLPGGTHTFQTFNNCGPAAMSMALSYYGITETQQVLGEKLRPYQNRQGDNDDKSVTLQELAQLAPDYNLLAYHRPNGTIDLVKQFIAHDIPVVTRTWLKPDDDIGHYRVIKGYDDDTGEFIQDDSLQGKNLRYSYQVFNDIWKKFSYEYVIFVPPDKRAVAEAIMGPNTDEQYAWRAAVRLAGSELEANPDDAYARFNLSVAYYHVGDYRQSVAEFEQIENILPFRMLWYQIEPIRSYFELGDYERVFAITDRILNNQNRAFAELYYLRGQIEQKRGRTAAARAEYEKAVLYHKHYAPALDALATL